MLSHLIACCRYHDTSCMHARTIMMTRHREWKLAWPKKQQSRSFVPSKLFSLTQSFPFDTRVSWFRKFDEILRTKKRNSLYNPIIYHCKHTQRTNVDFTLWYFLIDRYAALSVSFHVSVLLSWRVIISPKEALRISWYWCRTTSAACYIYVQNIVIVIRITFLYQLSLHGTVMANVARKARTRWTALARDDLFFI